MKSAKTAGSSILRGMLEKQIAGIVHQKDHPDEFNGWLKKITDRDLEEYFIFSVVRNPWDRVVSITSYFDIPLGDFLRNFNEHIQNEVIRSHSLPLSLYTHKDDVMFVDMVCRMESLQPDINLILDRIGLPRQSLPFMNTSSRRHYSEYYQDEDQELVAEIYKDDIRNFGYMFQSERIEKEKSFFSKFNPFHRD
jgi:hypothetical protein